MPFHLMTRAEFRDSIRRKLGIVPPVDVSAANPAGSQPTNSPYPTNMQINDALQDAVSDINRTCGFHVNEFFMSVPAALPADHGPFQIYLGDLTSNPTLSPEPYLPTPGRIVDVQRVVWVPDGGGTLTLLQPVYRDNLDRAGVTDYYALLPGVPEQWYIEGYSFFVTPAQSVTGRYLFTCGTGVAGFVCDDATLDEIPYDYQNVFEYQAIVNLSMTQTMDVEAQARAQMYAPKAAEGMKRFKEWKLGGTGAPQAFLLFRSYRTGYGTRRTTR